MPEILFADDPKAPPAPPVLCAASPDDGAPSIPANAGRAMECAVLRPIDLSATHGVNITAEILQQMVDSYDPAFEAAPLNFDHAWGGPSHGWCSKVWLAGETFWARFEQLSQEAVDAIASGRWPRRSSEFYLQHPQAKVPYFIGLALLGNSSPAVPGLPAAQLLSRPITRLIQIPGAEGSAPAAALGTGQKETQMPDQNTAPPAAADAPAAPATNEPVTPVEPVNLSAEREALRAEREQLRAELATARRTRAEASVDKLVTELGARVTPAMLRAGLRETLIDLAAAETPAVVHLTADGKPVEKPLFDTLAAILKAAPEVKVLGAAPLAAADPEGDDTRAAGTVALHERHGLSKERLAELQRKYQFN